MTISLDATLKAAQDGQSHHIIAELKSKPIVADIPFTGDFLTEESLNESKANTLTHSSGRICTIYKFNDTQFKYVYTDTDRQEFSFVALDVDDDLGGGILETTIQATITELTDAGIGIVYISETSTYTYLKWVKLSILGIVLDYGTIEARLKTDSLIEAPDVITLANDSYLLGYFSSDIITPTSGGTYTGGASAEYEMYITQEGSKTTAWFKWRKDGGAWSAEIQCTGAAQNLSDGVTVTFVTATYYIGTIFLINASPATYAKGYITINENPIAADEFIIGATTYTHQNAPLGGGGNPNDVAIDVLDYAITLQNLMCAINDETYEGTGEGVRYGTGTVANASVSATRSGYTVTVTAKAAGTAGNSITITEPSAYSASAMTGGVNASISDVQSSTNSLIKKRTSADFETWAAESDVDIAGIVAVEKTNLSFIQLTGGDVWILFDNYDEWTYANIYYAVSADNGASWSAATVLSAYDSALASAKHPVAVQKTATTLHVVYHEERGALHITEDSYGWPGGVDSITGVHVYNNKVYGIATWDFYGNKYFIAVVEIDIATWRITRSWNTTTTPGFHTIFANKHCWWNSMKHDGKYIVICNASGIQKYPCIAVLNVDANTIKHYFYEDYDTYGVAKNVNWAPSDSTVGEAPFAERSVSFAAIDDINDNLYIVLTGGYTMKPVIQIECIDLTQTVAPGSNYTSTTVYASPTGEFSYGNQYGLKNGDFYLVIGSALAFLSMAPNSGYQGRLVKFVTGGSWSKVDLGGDLPYWGLERLTYDGSNLWGTFQYDPLHGESEKKGLCRYEVLSGLATYYEPVLSYQVDDYKMWNIWLTDAMILIIGTTQYGIILYNIITNEWSVYDNDTVPGLTILGNDKFGPVTYDEVSAMIFTGISTSVGGGISEGLVGFSVYGTLKHPLYKIGTLTDAWNFAAAADFVVGYLDAGCAITLDPLDNGIFVFWTIQIQAELSIKWGKETPEFDLTPYIVRSNYIIIKTAIDGTPNMITFAVSKGHLFDPFNAASLWRNYVKKGYKVIVRLGELVNNIEYWQNQGSFVITERSIITYERGKYPVMEINGEDKRTLWEEMEIDVGVDYTTGGQTPRYILEHLLEDDAGELDADIDIPDFNNTTTLYHQWIEMAITEIIQQIIDRYGYFFKVTVDDDNTCRKISDDNDIDHIYTDVNSILTFTPDDTFSDYVNRIICTCESREFQTNIKNEETVITTVTGTLGWWGEKEEKQIWFDTEKDKQYYPIDITNLQRGLRSIESAKANMMFRLAGSVQETITEWADDNTYCILRLGAPDLRPIILTSIFAYIAAASNLEFGGKYIQAAAFAVIMYILGSVTSYNYEIMGYPIGYNRLSYQAVANDIDLQTMTGKIIKKTIDEPLAYYIDEAQIVANFEMLITRLQRKRIKLTKVAHMQDESGDTITLLHPYSGRNIDVFITNITRKLKLPETVGGGGTFEDDLEGWVLT